MATVEVSTPLDQSPNTISQEHLLRLLDISARLSSTLRLDELLDLVMTVSTQLTNTEAASILLVDNKSGKLHFVASSNQTITGETEVPMDSIAGWVVQNGRYQILGDVQTDERHFSGVDEELEFVTRSMLAVPLITNDIVIGVLEVLNKHNNEAYTEQDVFLMQAVASQSAVAIMNARLFHQSDLLAEIMHEVKTPLMAIQTASQLLARPELPQEKHDEVVGMIQRESRRLSKMTIEFLDMARLESGRVALAKQPVNLNLVIKDVFHITSEQASQRGITVVETIAAELPAPDTPLCVIGDSDRLKQVLLNLVSNAIKYNRENGRIAIDARLKEGGVCISVADTGYGIEPTDLEHLFERFYRIPGSDQSAEGTGLGLSVAKTIVEQHNGRIEVESTVGKGTTFSIHLPLSKAD